MKSTTIVCMVCGQKVRRTGSNQKYCPVCAENVKRENNRHRATNTGIRAAITPYIPPAPAPPRPKTLAGKSIIEVSRMARAAGMSYGVFVARDGQK